KNRKFVISRGPSLASNKLAGTRRSEGARLRTSLYVDNLLLIGNDVKILGNIKAWLSTQFPMKHMDEASYILASSIGIDPKGC
ncbi:UNVERIFIED_CONTAM: hypothetical protein Sindi_0071800, partial [Sesamum indicum]